MELNRFFRLMWRALALQLAWSDAPCGSLGCCPRGVPESAPALHHLGWPPADLSTPESRPCCRCSRRSCCCLLSPCLPAPPTVLTKVTTQLQVNNRVFVWIVVKASHKEASVWLKGAALEVYLTCSHFWITNMFLSFFWFHFWSFILWEGTNCWS